MSGGGVSQPKTFEEWDETPEASELCTMFSKVTAYARAAWDDGHKSVLLASARDLADAEERGRASREAEVRTLKQRIAECPWCSVEEHPELGRVTSALAELPKLREQIKTLTAERDTLAEKMERAVSSVANFTHHYNADLKTFAALREQIKTLRDALREVIDAGFDISSSSEITTWRQRALALTEQEKPK